MSGPWRDPDEESVDLYPGLVVCDNRHSGSITVGRSRLPLNAIVPDAIASGFPAVEHDWLDGAYEWDQKQMIGFLYDLLEARGEFGRLLLELANAERMERSDRAWWEMKKYRKRLASQLRRCLAVVEDSK